MSGFWTCDLFVAYLLPYFLLRHIVHLCPGCPFVFFWKEIDLPLSFFLSSREEAKRRKEGKRESLKGR